MACVSCVKYLPIDSFGPYLLWTQYVSDTRLKSWCTWSGLWMRHDEKWKSIYWQLLLSALIVMMRNHIVKAYGISKVAVINDCNLRGLRQQELCFLLFLKTRGPIARISRTGFTLEEWGESMLWLTDLLVAVGSPWPAASPWSLPSWSHRFSAFRLESSVVPSWSHCLILFTVCESVILMKLVLTFKAHLTKIIFGFQVSGFSISKSPLNQ